MDQRTVKHSLRRFIEHESEAMLGTLRYYLSRAGLAGRGEPLDSAARELLNAVVVEALSHEERFRASSQPRAWLLGIAANLVRRQQTELAQRDRREPLLRDLHPALEESMSDDELFDWIAEVAAVASPDDLDTHDELSRLLTELMPQDARIVRLAIFNGLDGAALARELGISAGAARVRLHRALNRLRALHLRQEEQPDA
ncbi:MAG: sigma-70 family RNA polymerase sigma factor [Anaerolineae bacterium]|nr:sigma-70 family RNA polymerase sigma factor [Anaerolineae bacterium]